VRDWRRALVLVPSILVFLVFMGTQDRFFARWLLPVYPLLCLLAAYGNRAAARVGARAPGPPAPGGAAAAAASCCARRGSCS
jgi:hypothetical protein